MQNNIPVDMISFCSTLGEVKPLRIRLENEAHERVSADIIEIAYRKQIKPSGLTILIYGCRLELFGEIRLAELHYHTDSGRWTLFRMVS
ncbi:hypothetical protein [Lachnoclostridium sp.]|uniref:hypothetical protein n=1 Tax=Lachnoclostridium sp. TaxID=2028282 RepID=UPI00289830D3|nr:hypothetical protein [Lachnoclostridium sp.]